MDYYGAFFLSPFRLLTSPLSRGKLRVLDGFLTGS